MSKEEKEFDLINYDGYKSYYQDTSKEEILHDTWLDYCAYRNIIEKNTELQSKLDIANKKIDKIKEIINSFLDNWECGGALTEYHITGEPPSKDLQDILSIIGGE